MAGKLADVYAITNTEENIFYSAYLKHRIQYNDVDPDKITFDQESPKVEELPSEDTGSSESLTTIELV